MIGIEEVILKKRENRYQHYHQCLEFSEDSNQTWICNLAIREITEIVTFCYHGKYFED